MVFPHIKYPVKNTQKMIYNLSLCMNTLQLENMWDSLYSIFYCVQMKVAVYKYSNLQKYQYPKRDSFGIIFLDWLNFYINKA